MSDWTREQRIQREIVQYLHLVLPDPPDGPVWTAVNPVPAKSRAAAGKSKAMGLRAGWPDLMFVWRTRALFVEVKAPGGRAPQYQRAVHAELEAVGAAVRIVRGVEEMQAVLREAGVPLRGHVPTRERVA